MKRESETREWLNEYVSLKQVNPECPFNVPEGYFESLSGMILSKISLEEAKGGKQETGFTVPQNYFSELNDNINSRINIGDANDKTAMGFLVPDGYFKSSAEQINARINIEAAADAEQNSFTVPYGYFDELSAQITARINIEEQVEKDAPGFAIPGDYFENLQQQIQSRIQVDEILSTQSGEFTVPDNYFNKLTDDIISQTVAKEKQRKGGAIIRRLITSGAIKYASAACLVLAVGGTLFFNRTIDPNAEHNKSFLHKSLAAIPSEDIQNYLQLHLDGNDTRVLMDETKAADAVNLSNDLQQALDTASQ